MKILVLIKKTPDTEAKVGLSANQTELDLASAKFIINPYDEYAIEQALLIKEKLGTGEVVVVSFGDESTKEIIVKGLAMGGDRGVLVKSEGLPIHDSYVCAQVLAELIRAEKPNMVWSGRHAIDDDNMHVPTMCAEFLGWPHVNVVSKFELQTDKVNVERSIEGGQVEVYDVSLPAFLGADKSLNKPRYASLPGIMKAKKKPLEEKTVSDLGLSASDLKSKTKITKYVFPPEKPAGKVFKDEEVGLMVEKVVKLLREEAKVI